jgi:PAS domain S-box-containing protein
MGNRGRVPAGVTTVKPVLMEKILVIDDDGEFRSTVSMTLRRHGYDVCGASDGATGLATALAEQPDLVLSDVNMAGQNGFELLKELRACPETSAIPVILMTGDPQYAGARSSMDRGADDYLQKPFSAEILLASVRARLQRQEVIKLSVEAKVQKERISAEEKLLLLTSALEAAANGIVITERDGTILWVNHAFTRLTGYSAEEAVGRNPRLLKSGQHPPEFYEDLWAAITAGDVWHGELVNKRKDGRCYLEEMTITPVCGPNGEIRNFIAIKQDVSKRKQIEQVLARERDLLRALMDNLPDHIYFKDVNSCFIRINQAHARHLGLQKPEDAIGKSDADFFSSSEARQKLVDEQCLLATGKPILGLVEKVEIAGVTHWVSSTKVPIYGADGKSTGLVGISRDITAAKQAELERQAMETQLRQSQKLESIGQLAAGIAHEINTPTQYVGDNTRFVQDSFAEIYKVLKSHEKLLAAVKANTVTPELVSRSEEILAASDLDYLAIQIPTAIGETLEGVERVSKIVRAMKEFSHPGGKEKKTADLNKAIESTVTVARNEWKYVADLKLDLQPDLPFVPCFLGEFNQCVLNLIVNAAHAIGDVVKKNPGTKGLITVQTRRDGDQVEVRVTDTGTGIPESVREKIFEPFFTTKDVGKGTGQGLAMAYGSIVKRHGGTVTFETEVGKGTTFIIRLPLKPRNASEAVPPQPMEMPAG